MRLFFALLIVTSFILPSCAIVRPNKPLPLVKAPVQVQNNTYISPAEREKLKSQIEANLKEIIAIPAEQKEKEEIFSNSLKW